MPTILVADDNPDCLESLARLLRLLGNEVFTADCGPAALEEAVCHHPQLMFVDIAMRGMDGFQVARRLRENPATRDATIVALSGLATEEFKQQAMAAGFDRHLAKPVDLSTLEQLLRAQKSAKQPVVLLANGLVALA